MKGLVVILAVAIASAAPASAQVLWQRAEAGMTPAQIQEIYPGARLHPSLEDRAQMIRRRPQDAELWSRHDNYLLENTPGPNMRMQFKFGPDQRLQWVALIGRGRDDWGNVVAGLRERYGAEASHQPIAGDGSETMIWRTRTGVTITARFEGNPPIARIVPEARETFSVRYEVRRSMRDAL